MKGKRRERKRREKGEDSKGREREGRRERGAEQSTGRPLPDTREILGEANRRIDSYGHVGRILDTKTCLWKYIRENMRELTYIHTRM